MLSKGGLPCDPKPLKICGVCGDCAKSYHFGGISCDSCKAFFRRSVQNDNFRLFQCAFHGNCDITMANRKCCQYCRFQKCLDIGMEISWVMSEKERLLMLRARMEKRQQQRAEAGVDAVSSADTSSPTARASSSRTPSPAAKRLRMAEDDGSRTWGSAMDEVLDETEKEEVDALVALFDNCFNLDDERLEAASKGASSGQGGGPGYSSSWLVLVHFVTSIQKLVRFARGIRLFSNLPVCDQIALLRANIFEMYLAVHFGLREELPGDRIVISDQAVGCSFLAAGDGIVPRDSAYGSLFRSLIPDMSTLVLLLAVVLFGPDMSDPEQGINGDSVEERQLHYCNLLDKQLRQRHGVTTRGSSSVLARVLLLLPTLREIRDKHVAYHFDIHGRDFDFAESWMFQTEEGADVDSVTKSEFSANTDCWYAQPY